MGWRFRQSFKIIPGVRLNLSKSGLSCSVGGAPFTFNVGTRGAFSTLSLPGTGISFRQHLSNAEGMPAEHFPAVPNIPASTPEAVSTAVAAPIEEVRSASTELLTSESLKELKKVIETAHQEREDIHHEFEQAQEQKRTAYDRHFKWDDGFLFKRLFKQKFAQRKANLETAEAKVLELDQQLQQTTVSTQLEIAKEQAEPYFRMRDAFASLSECAGIWDVKTHQAADRFRERTTAVTRIEREPVRFSLDMCELIQWQEKVPHLGNANGGDLFLYPGFILYRAGRGAFSVIDYHDLKGRADSVKFQEDEPVPSDSKIIGQTWLKANKDGSRDKRFAANREIPIVHYGSLTLKTETGLWEEFHFSNPERLLRFSNALNDFTASYAGNTSRLTVEKPAPVRPVF